MEICLWTLGTHLYNFKGGGAIFRLDTVEFISKNLFDVDTILRFASRREARENSTLVAALFR